MRNHMIFMLSNWYSGATLFAFLLNNHEQLVCNGETFPFAYDKQKQHLYFCSCGEQIKKCPFYSSTCFFSDHFDNDFGILPKFSGPPILGKFLLSSNHFTSARDSSFFFLPKQKLELENFLNKHNNFVGQALSLNNGEIYVDGTKAIRRLEFFMKFLESPPKAIHLIRDGRGFCCSYIKNNKLDKGKIPFAAKKWIEYISLVDKVQTRYPFLEIETVRYEDLCNNIENSLREVCKFLGVEFKPEMIAPPKNHHIFGNRMRNDFNGTINEDQSWRTFFTAPEVQQLENHMGDFLTRYGYI